MRVKYAAQIFSHSIFAGILTASRSGQLKSKTVADTTAFVKQINNIFDCLNSRVVRNSNLTTVRYQFLEEYLKQLSKKLSIF